ncbi:hypothetical protein [uncultured Chryseobacterium sp.]|uniref:hypothetical protein n=1 Tax=uncultured Chryseobacterium sp. TaxID=259322 RepID=UPI0025E7469F|nr:hypothetical protein [uncultured Chryseobacterium sp.]
MKKLLFTGLLSLGVLLPTSISATIHDTGSKTEFSSKKPGKSRKSSRSRTTRSKSSARSSRAYSPSSKSCNYNGHQLFTGERGGCYYYSGNSKKYVDRAYCSGCN